jgi:hypothetical protein
MVVALLALFVALDGPATASRLIDGRSIERNSVTSRQIRNGTVGTSDLSKTAQKRLRTTPAASVGAVQLRPKAVTAAKLAGGAVGTGALAPKSVDATKLADGAVGSGQLGAEAVTGSRIAGGAVGAAAVADGGLQTRDLGDFYGSVMVDFTPFAPNTCQVAKDIVPQASAPAQGNVIADDVVSVSPSAGWPDPLVVSANPGAGNTLRIVACRIGRDPAKADADPTDLIDPSVTTFQYVAFDAP